LTPDEFTEVANVHTLEGKTWNHPVLVRDTLLLRNGEEMAAYKLPLEGRWPSALHIEVVARHDALAVARPPVNVLIITGTCGPS